VSGFDLDRVLKERAGENYALHQQLLNPQLANVLQTLGFDKFYVRGEGCWLWDETGERYLDTLAGFGVFALGRSHPTIKAALHQAIDADLANLVQLDCALLAGLLAEQLVARAHPGIDRCVFTNSGAEAVEVAIKFSRQATGKNRILYADHAFHGLTTGALALNGGAGFKAGFGKLLPGATPVPFGDLDALRKELAKGDVAAFIVEPIQGKGVHLAPAEYWQGRRRGADRHRADRPVLRLRALRHRAGRDHRGEGALRRLHARRRNARLRQGRAQRAQVDE
jgi:ornithine--oxo-acid transaminase